MSTLLVVALSSLVSAQPDPLWFGKSGEGMVKVLAALGRSLEFDADTCEDEEDFIFTDASRQRIASTWKSLQTSPSLQLVRNALQHIAANQRKALLSAGFGV